MNDCIIYVKDIVSFMQYAKLNLPGVVEEDEEGVLRISGLSRSRTVIEGNEAMTYVRLNGEELPAWESRPYVEMWGTTSFIGEGTADSVYAAVFDDPDRSATYQRIYPTDPVEVSYVDDGELIEYTVTPPARFGILAGA